MTKANVGKSKNNISGFTIVELLIFICIAGILATIGIPAFSSWVPDYRLRNKAKELYADMHFAKIKALRENDKYRIVFSTGSNASYRLVKPDGDVEKKVILQSTESNENISYGCDAATKNATKSGGAPPSDGISYNGNVLTFNPRGTGSPGYVYLQNKKGTSYAIGTLSSGLIHLKKWDKSKKSWK